MENKPATTSNTSTKSTTTNTSTPNTASSPEVKPPSPIMHSFTETKSTSSFSGKALVVLVVIALLGIGTGYGLSQLSAGPGNKILPLPKVSSVEKGKIYGVTDTKAYPDTAEGKLEDGGIEGEGQYHLVRPGGDSQNVYMTSSTVDLSQFIGKKIKVWGATQTAQTAGWLMDVGKVEVQ